MTIEICLFQFENDLIHDIFLYAKLVHMNQEIVATKMMILWHNFEF